MKSYIQYVNFFVFVAITYCQKSGLAIESLLPPILADIFMNTLESKKMTYNKSFRKTHKWYSNYLDHISIIWNDTKELLR